MPLRLRAIDDPAPRSTLEHDLQPYFERWSRFRSRLQLRRDPEFRRRRAEVEDLLTGFEWEIGNARPASDRERVRAVAWNVERGKRWDPLLGLLQEHPVLSDSDLLLLTELDIGMGRSGNRNVPRDLARILGFDYVFANFHLVLAPGDSGEQDHDVPNTLAMHGCALLSRYPVRRFAAVSLPEFTDKFKVLEKRLGTKRALLCEVELPDGPATVVVVHLDPFASPRHRGRQAQLIVDAIEEFGGGRVLLGGDLNTNTYNLGSKMGLAANIAHKLVRFGVAGTVAQYMTPEEVFERRTFEVLRRAGLATEPFRDPRHGSTYYDMTDPELVEKSLGYLPKPVLRWLERRLQPWEGCVPLRIDWFAGRDIEPARTLTIDRPVYQGSRVSDHNPIVVDLRG